VGVVVVLAVAMGVSAVVVVIVGNGGRRRRGKAGLKSLQNCCGCFLLRNNYFLTILLLNHAYRKGEMETHSGTKD